MDIIKEDRDLAKKKLMKLAFSYSDVNDMDFKFSSYGFKSIIIPEHDGHIESEIVISGQFYKLYGEFIKFLESQKNLEYMVDNSSFKAFVEEEIHKFIYDVLFDRKYRDTKELKKRINEILDLIYKPLEKYKVVIPIRCFYTEEIHVFEIEDSIINKLDLDKLNTDITAKFRDFEIKQENWSKYENKYFITIYEEGNNINSVVKRARKKAEEYLDFLRLYTIGMPYKSFAARYIGLNKAVFVYNSNDILCSLVPFFDEQEPAVEKLNEESVDRIYDTISELKKLNQIKDPKIKERIKRSVHWIGKAISEFDLDVRLCQSLD